MKHMTLQRIAEVCRGIYYGPEELLEKAEYYLTHEHERREIALAGQRKVLHRFTHEKKLKELFKWVEGE